MSTESDNIVDGSYVDSAGLQALQYALDLPFDVYAERFLKIRTKNDGIQPFKLNVGQRHLDAIAERQLKTRGYVRVILLKSRQWGGCLAPDTPVLTADLRWVPIRDIREGDELVSCDEQPAAGAPCRKMRTATVQKVWRTRKPTFRITFDDDSSVVCSADHRWLSRKSQTQAAWRSIGGSSATNNSNSQLKIGDHIRSITESWGESTLDDAWLRVMGLSRPTRFINKRWWEGLRMPDNGWRRIVAIDPGPVKELIDIQTTTGAYVAANGLVSHNSTYIEGRFYRRITQGQRGQRAMIVTQSKLATGNIFGMAQRFHKEMDPRLRPFSSRAAVTQLVFPKRDAQYAVGTAGSLNIGRSDTIQFLHASEHAFWPNAESHMAGVFQTVPERGPGTEIWIESTGMGMNNEFHNQCDLARKGLGEYEFVFVPWFWFDEYRAEPKPDLHEHLTKEDREYQEVYGLDDEQMAFRQIKIIGFGGGQKGREKFQTEYPACPEDAFSTTGEGSYIDPLLVARARKARVANPWGPKILGIDPSWLGKDRFSVHLRQGRKATIVGEWQGRRTTQSVGKCVQIIKRLQPEVVFVDAIGIGAGVVDQLTELQTQLNCRVVTVMASDEADDERLYGNKRCEMYGRMLEWLQMDQPVQIDDRDDLQRDLTVLQLEYDTANRPRPESKQKLKKRGLASPDHSDSLSLTFAYDVSAFALGRAGSDIDPDRPLNWRAV